MNCPGSTCLTTSWWLSDSI